MPAPVAVRPEDFLQLRLNERPFAAGRAIPTRPGLPWRWLCLGCGALVTVVVYFAQQQTPGVESEPSAPAQVLAAAMSPPRPEWTPIARALPIYGITAPGQTSLPLAFVAQSNGTGARQDTLTFGAFEHEAERHVRVMLHRSAAPEVAEVRFFLDLARQASSAGLAVIRSTPSEALATKFGPVEASEVTLSEGAERACFGFRFVHQGVGFRFAGWLCPPRGQPLDRQELACTIDRLMVLNAGPDEPLRGLFAEADRRKIEGCATAPAAGGVEPRTVASRSRRQARPSRRPESVNARKGSAAVRREPARGTGRG
jgi:hypothetical protein